MTMQIEKAANKKADIVISDMASAAIRTRRCVKMNLEELVTMYENNPEKRDALIKSFVRKPL